MTLPLDLQFYAFSVMVLAGAGLGALFDLYRAARHTFHPRGWALAATDLLFCAAAATLAAVALYYGNWIELRLYVFIGAAAGLGLYHGLASAAVFRLARAAIGGCVALVRRAWALARRLLGRLTSGLLSPARSAVRKARESAGPRVAAVRARVWAARSRAAAAGSRARNFARTSVRRARALARRCLKWLLSPPGS